MATSGGQTLESLYIELGLDMSRLESDILAADRTVTENLGRLSRERNLIQLRAEVEIAGLDETADAERILEIRQQALNRQMSLQRDRVRLLEAEFRHLTSTQGENSVAAQRAQIRLERERLALANLERDLRNLNGATDESSSIFGELADLLPEIPTKFQAVGMAVGALTAGLGAATTAVTDLLESFRELQNQSYELNMSVPDTRDFLRRVKLGGGDIGDFEGFIRGITDAYVKGEYDDPEFIALRKYNAEITDATGRLKDFKDITEEVYQAWKKADEAGEGIEFLQLTGGEAGVRDAIQFFKRYEEAKEDAEKIFTVEVDEKQLHQLDRTMNMVDEQAGELKNAIGDIFVPAAQSAAESFFEILHDGTQTLAENKDTIQRWGFTAKETFSTVADKWHELTSYQRANTGNAEYDKQLNRLDWSAAEFNEQSLWGSNSLVREAYSEFFGDLGKYTGITERAEERQHAYNEELSGTKTVSDSVAKGLAALSNVTKDNGSVLSQYGVQRIKEFKDELEDLKVELEFGDNDYLKSLAQLDLWRDRELGDKLQVSDEERAAIEELYAAKREQIEQETADKLAEIRDKIAAADKTTFENRLADIEKEKQAWIQAGMDKIEADELAQKKREQLEEEIRDKVADIRKSINAEYQTELENQIDKIKDEQQAWIDMGVAASEAAELAGQKMELAFQKAVDKAKTLNQSLEDKIFAQEHSQYENDVRKLQQEVARTAKEFQERGIFDDTAREKLNRYYNNALRDLNARAAQGGDYTKTPTGAKSPIQILDLGQQRQQDFGIFADEKNARQSVIKSLNAEQLKRLEETGALEKIISAQNSLVDSTEQAAGNLQDASQSIEIIHGDEIAGQQSFDSVEMPSIDDLLQQFGNSLPTGELQSLTTETQAVTTAQGDLKNSTENLSEKNLTLADTADKVKSALKNLAEDNAKKSGGQEDPAVQKFATKSAPLDNAEQYPPREKVHLQTKPKDDSYKLEDLGFNLDLFGALTGLMGLVGLATTAPVSLPALAGGVGLAGLVSLLEGSRENYLERINAADKNFSLDDGTSIDMDFSELVSPLSNLDTNVQGIRDILQGKNAVSDANAEATPDTSEGTSADILTPLSSIDETAKTILSELQSRQNENDTVSEMQSEISTQISEGTSQITESIATPIENLAQALETIRTQNEAQDTAASEGAAYLETVASTVQNILDNMQANTDAEPAAQTDTPAEAPDYLTPLTNIRDSVSGIWSKMQETAQPLDSAPQENIREILSPILTNVNTPFSELRDAITAKQFELPTINFPTEVIVQPLNNIANLIDKILSALSNRELPKIEVSPNIDVDLGGAYVFDNNLKTELVTDITSNIVTRITEAVERATASSSRSSGYGFGN